MSFLILVGVAYGLLQC